MADPSNDLRGAGFGEIVKQLSQETSTLVRQELELAKAEMTVKAKRAGVGAGLIGGALVVVLAAVGALVAFLILLLAEGMADWGAALIVGAVLLAIAAAMAILGRNKIRQATPPVPEETVESVKEDVEWAKTRISSANK